MSTAAAVQLVGLALQFAHVIRDVTGSVGMGRDRSCTARVFPSCSHLGRCVNLTPERVVRAGSCSIAHHPLGWVRHSLPMGDRVADLAPTSVQLAVGPVHYAIALRPDDPVQLRAAVDLACRWWGGISFPWVTLDSEGAVTDGSGELCSVLDVAGIIDLTLRMIGTRYRVGFSPRVAGDVRRPAPNGRCRCGAWSRLTCATP